MIRRLMGSPEDEESEIIGRALRNVGMWDYLHHMAGLPVPVAYMARMPVGLFTGHIRPSRLAFITHYLLFLKQPVYGLSGSFQGPSL